tara:strand:- start:468 stop:650 length:183 start_codon:yes stop_codon:yes gene_type:complete
MNPKYFYALMGFIAGVLADVYLFWPSTAAWIFFIFISLIGLYVYYIHRRLNADQRDDWEL